MDMYDYAYICTFLTWTVRSTFQAKSWFAARIMIATRELVLSSDSGLRTEVNYLVLTRSERNTEASRVRRFYTSS
jgi:hypothetical protein